MYPSYRTNAEWQGMEIGFTGKANRVSPKER